MKLTPKPCPYCGEEYQPKASNQIACYKVGCRIKAREREKSKEKERRRQRNYMRRRRQMQRELGLLVDGQTGARPCLKCGASVPYGRHLCDLCRKQNQEIYYGVW